MDNGGARYAEARREFNGGRPDDAERTCRAILVHQPAAVDALNLLAVILSRRGEFEPAVALLERALAHQPTDAQARGTLRDIGAATGRFTAAAAAFARAAELRPDDPGLAAEAGLILTKDGQREHAVEALRRAIALDPATANYHVALGIVLVELARLDEAVVTYRHALARHPGVPELHVGLGAALMKQGRCEEAIDAYGQAATLAPKRAGYWLAEANLGMGLHLRTQGRHAAAAAAFEQALALRPQWPDAHNCLGVVLKEMGRSGDAVVAFRRAIAFDAAHASAHSNLGMTLQEAGAFEEAAATLRTAVALAPTVEACGNLAGVLRDLGHTDEARDFYERAVARDPNSAVARFNRGLALLLEGDFSAGWADYEQRRDAFDLIARRCQTNRPEWQGEALAGRTILLSSEQGLGDAIQFARFAPLLEAMGGRVVLRVQQPLVRLFAAAFPTMRVIGRNEPIPSFDCHLPLMSLPWRLGTTLATIPADVPYLVVAAEAGAHWRRRLAAATGVKIGLAWSGNPATKHDRLRSIPLRTLLPHLPREGVSLFSLQKDVRPDDQSTLATDGAHITDLSDALGDFADTAAALSALDLVISVDSAVAHLAGALARPTWVLVHEALDWRWLRHRADSPWYPTLRLFRQSRAREWSDVLVRLGAAVRTLAATPPA